MHGVPSSVHRFFSYFRLPVVFSNYFTCFVSFVSSRTVVLPPCRAHCKTAAGSHVEASFLEKLKAIEGISTVETQTYTLEEVLWELYALSPYQFGQKIHAFLIDDLRTVGGESSHIKS